MPELPEVETIARTLSPMVRGHRITAVEVLLPGSVDKGSLSLSELVGRVILDTGRRGKLALLHLVPPSSPESSSPSSATAHALAVHLKMTGRLFVYGPEQRPGTHTRIVFHLEDSDGTPSRLFFDDARTFGYVRLLSPSSLGQWDFWNCLGPEPLEHSPAALAHRLDHKRGGIKSLLLDQTVVAGIGNIYADEALFRAGLDPRRKADSISLAHKEQLFAKVQEVLQESIAQCGSSIRDYRTARGDAGAFQNTFRVYGRSGQACLTCGTALTTLKVAGRTTVCCSRCQK